MVLGVEILGVQIIGVLFSLFMIYYSFLHFKRKEFTLKEFGFWLAAWALLILFAVFPKTLEPLAKGFGFARIMDLVIVVGFIFLIGVITYTYTIVRKTQNKIEEIVRKVAIKDAEEKSIKK